MHRVPAIPQWDPQPSTSSLVQDPGCLSRVNVAGSGECLRICEPGLVTYTRTVEVGPCVLKLCLLQKQVVQTDIIWRGLNLQFCVI